MTDWLKYWNKIDTKLNRKLKWWCFWLNFCHFIITTAIRDLNEDLEERSEKRKYQRIFDNYDRRQPRVSIKSLTRGKTGRWSEGWRDHFFSKKEERPRRWK